MAAMAASWPMSSQVGAIALRTLSAARANSRPRQQPEAPEQDLAPARIMGAAEEMPKRIHERLARPIRRGQISYHPYSGIRVGLILINGSSS